MDSVLVCGDEEKAEPKGKIMFTYQSLFLSSPYGCELRVVTKKQIYESKQLNQVSFVGLMDSSLEQGWEVQPPEKDMGVEPLLNTESSQQKKPKYHKNGIHWVAAWVETGHYCWIWGFCVSCKRLVLMQLCKLPVTRKTSI